MKARVLAKGLTLIAGLALLGYAFQASDWGRVLNRDWIDAHVRGHGLRGELLFLLMGGMFTAAGLPRQAVAFLAGYAFGVTLGTALGALAAFLGCMLAYGFARLFGRGALRARLGGRAARFGRFIDAHPFAMTVLVRLLPAGSNFATNLAAGVAGIRPLPFFAGSLLGYLPQSLVFALVGSGAHVSPATRGALAAGLFVVSALLGTWLYRHFQHGMSLDARIDEVLDAGPPPEDARSV